MPPETSHEKILDEQLGRLVIVTEKPEILFARDWILEEVMKKVEELHPPVAERARAEGRGQM